LHEKWLDRAEYDLETARAMFTTGRYVYVIFMCQQGLEKCLKALLAFQGKEIPPIHNLRRLVEAVGAVGNMGTEELRRIDFLSQYYLNARYKDDLRELVRAVSKEIAREYLEFAEGKARWLTQKMKP
jgi:HEPN domain-containing protein